LFVTHVADEVLRDESRDGGKARLRPLHTSALLVAEGRAAALLCLGEREPAGSLIWCSLRTTKRYT